MKRSKFRILAWLLFFCAISQGKIEANLTGISLFTRPDSFASMFLRVNAFDESFNRCRVAMGLASAIGDVSCRKSLRLINEFSDLVGMGVIRDDEKTLKRVLDFLIQYRDHRK
ncbi:hypothetical protein [Rhizobium leguminosarum]|uniref:hypothetical protein n=1 Tax=Rhizobium leguminosarum TaxID=384 RepID=UPI00103A3F4D|nr:hypothetical protein [Rhizobium leguminosarum]MBY5792830.1 hypothetical protein [Rhizobium leguminosarum]MBY5825732.1 hypothetical protein [Rhizobium leguminosarum]NKN01427.1 hypothetical protein [Rhizobium leguminosarum bv. viciae]TBY81938.1 hypothetical protein E0H32_16910 [Rhizobium leguminosarum bv. viciae]